MSKSNKQKAIDFEEMIVDGKIAEAYEKYVASDMCHHNPYFKGDRDALLAGMEKNQTQFADKKYKVERALEDGDLVATHSRLKLNDDMPELAVIHIYRFANGEIVEAWDVSQQEPEDSPNENGMF